LPTDAKGNTPRVRQYKFLAKQTDFWNAPEIRGLFGYERQVNVMTQWFQERYISREEHQQSITYYTKLVARLYRQVCELRAAQVDPQAIDALIEENRRKAEDEIHRHMQAPARRPRGNIITVDFHRRARTHI
jgi:hypothetical protein